MQVDDQLTSLAASFSGLRAMLSSGSGDHGDRSPGGLLRGSSGIMRHRRSIVQIGGGITASPAGRSMLAPIAGGDAESSVSGGGDFGGMGGLAEGSATGSDSILNASATTAAMVSRTGIVVSPALSQLAFQRVASATSPADARAILQQGPLVPATVWAGTWNVGAEEPVHTGAAHEDAEHGGAASERSGIPSSAEAFGGPPTPAAEAACKGKPAKGAIHPRMLRMLAPPGYDLYVLGIQEGMSDAVLDFFAQSTGTIRMPLVPCEEGKEGPLGGTPRGSMGGGKGGRKSHKEVTDKTAEGNDRVLGRGDGSLTTLKYTGIAVFVPARMLPFVRINRVCSCSFGATEGSKGGAGVSLRVHGATMAFISVHMASKKISARLQQYMQVCKQLGGGLGNEFFHLNESFHHVVFMGDFNYRCSGISGKEALALIANPKTLHGKLLQDHDDLRKHRAQTDVFSGYVEPPMGPALFPTYKKLEGRPRADYRDSSWPEGVYRILFKEVFYKGGFTVDRVPGWCDRLVYHSLPHLKGNMYPLSRGEAERASREGLEADAMANRGGGGAGHRGSSGSSSSPGRGGPSSSASSSSSTQRGSIGDVAGGITATTASLAKASSSGVPTEAPAGELARASSYDAVNDVLTVSDHSPVRCVFRVMCPPSPVGVLATEELEPDVEDEDGGGQVHGTVAGDEALGPVLVRLPLDVPGSGDVGGAAGAAAGGAGSASTAPSAFADEGVMATSNPLAGQSARKPAGSGSSSDATGGAGTGRPGPPKRTKGGGKSRSGVVVAIPSYLRAGLSAASALPSVGMTVVLRLTGIEAHGDSAVSSPSVVKVLCPAPFELGDEVPTAARATFDEKVRQTACTLRFTCKRASALAHAHLLVKCAITRGIKGHCVVPLRPLVTALDDAGTASQTYHAPLKCDGLTRLDKSGRPWHIQFVASIEGRPIEEGDAT